MKSIKVTKETTQFEDTCKYCGKLIKGTTESQVKSNMLIHKINSHPEKMEIIEKK